GRLSDQAARLELAEQTTERAAADHQAAQQITLPHPVLESGVDEHVELIGSEPVPGPELMFEPRHEVLVLPHHQPPCGHLDRAVLSDLPAGRRRLSHLLTHRGPMCPLPLLLRLQQNRCSMVYPAPAEGSRRLPLVDSTRYIPTRTPGPRSRPHGSAPGRGYRIAVSPRPLRLGLSPAGSASATATTRCAPHHGPAPAPRASGRGSHRAARRR